MNKRCIGSLSVLGGCVVATYLLTKKIINPLYDEVSKYKGLSNKHFDEP